jgi:putative transposase
MTATGIVVAGATTAITRRTAFRKPFLAPWHERVRDIWLYALALAQAETEVAIHHGVLVINHEHLIVTALRDNLPEFTWRLHHDVSCAINQLLARERYDAPHEMWDGREPHYMRLLDEGAQASHLIYQHLNCVAAGLVDRPEHMPDFAFDFGLWKTGVLEVRRPDVYFSEHRPETLRLCVSPPPVLYRAFGGDLERLVYHMERSSESALQSMRRARTRPVVGVKKIRRLHPWNEPRTLRESGGKRKPSFRIGARGVLGLDEEIACAREVRDFRMRYRRSFEARRAGDHAATFPFGTYQMRALHGAPTESSPALDAIVAMPGPSLADVIAELERAPVTRDDALARTTSLLDEVRDAFAEDAAEIVEHDAVGLDDELPRTSGESEDGDERTVVVRHRFGRSDDDENARRIIVLRDSRRGRPRRGNDPPA